MGLITLIVVRTLCDDVFAPLPRFYSDSMSDFARDLVRLQSCGALLVASSLPFHSFLFESPALKGQQLCRGIPYYLKESFTDQCHNALVWFRCGELRLLQCTRVVLQ